MAGDSGGGVWKEERKRREVMEKEEGGNKKEGGRGREAGRAALKLIHATGACAHSVLARR